MGILDDLAMGFGLKERTQDYDARTARNIAISEAAGNWGSSRGYSMSPAAMRAEARIRDRGNYDVNREGSQARAFLTRQGGDDPNYNPQIIQDDRPFLQRALFSPQDQLSPTPVAIGPLQFDEPLRIPGILGMITGGLGRFGGLFNPREVPTVSADGGLGRVSGALSNAGMNRFESKGARSHRAALAAGYPTPDLSPRDTDYMMDRGPQYTGAKDYALGYGHIDSPLLDFQPTTADMMESHIPLTSDGGAVEAVTTDEMAAYLKDKGINTTYMDKDLIRDLYDLQKGME